MNQPLDISWEQRSRMFLELSWTQRCIQLNFWTKVLVPACSVLFKSKHVNVCVHICHDISHHKGGDLHKGTLVSLQFTS